MKSFPSDLSATTKVLEPNYDDKTNDAINNLGERGFYILHGLTEELAGQIFAMAKESHIREYCPRDCTEERFADVASTKKWLSRGHAVFMIAKKNGDDWQIVGYGWSGPKETPEVPGGQTTFAVRLGEAGLGQKLSLPFSQAIIGATQGIYEAPNVWLETWASNAGAVHVYKELGFELVTEVPSQRPTSEGQKVEDTRLFMKLF